MNQQDATHVPVLLEEVCSLLAVAPGDTVVDCTVGLGGHARRLAEVAGPTGRLIGLDVDESNLSAAARHLEGCGCPFQLLRCNFSDLDEAIAESTAGRVSVIFADLGVSSTQLDDAGRGMSFQKDGPLDMRMDDRLADNAEDLVNRLPESELADILYQYGQERRSRAIARGIHRARRIERITSTARLAQIVARAMRVDPNSRAAKIHPATRTFQALRIAVNNELGSLERLLSQIPDHLQPGGRAGIISFHSLEDGLVKRDFLKRKGEGIYRIMTKKPVTASDAERESNPRSRSAKLRVATLLGAGGGQ